MKVEVARDKFLSNYEVYDHLKEVQAMHKWCFDPESKKDLSNKKYRQSHLVDLEAITRDLYSYLAKTDAKGQDPDSIKKLFQKLQRFQLEKIELLQILNFTPRNMVLLYTIIEECDQRFTEEECTDMLEYISECFPVVETNDNSDVEMQDAEPEAEGDAEAEAEGEEQE